MKDVWIASGEDRLPASPTCPVRAGTYPGQRGDPPPSPRSRMKSLFLLVLTAGLLTALAGADWPQWRGPDRTDVSRDTGLLKTWPANGPPLLWTFTSTGIGYSAPAVVGDRLYVMGTRGATEVVFALHTKDGKEAWSIEVGPTLTWQGN